MKVSASNYETKELYREVRSAARQLHSKLTWDWLSKDTDPQLRVVEQAMTLLKGRKARRNSDELRRIAATLLPHGPENSARLEKLMSAPRSIAERRLRAITILQGLQQVYPPSPYDTIQRTSRRVQGVTITHEQFFGPATSITAVHQDLIALYDGFSVNHLENVEHRIRRMAQRAEGLHTGSLLQTAHDRLQLPQAVDPEVWIYHPFKALG